MTATRHTPGAGSLDRVALQIVDEVFSIPRRLREVQLVPGWVEGLGHVDGVLVDAPAWVVLGNLWERACP